MSRSKWKGPFLNLTISTLNNQKNKLEKAARNSSIIPQFVGQTIQTCNGQTYLEVNITHDMIGHKLGEFVFSRKKFSFKKKKTTKKK